MKNLNINPIQTLKTSVLALITILAFAGCQAPSPTSSCDTVKSIEGAYECHGECIVFDKNGNRVPITVTGEKDVISKYPGAKEALYKVDITGDNGNFTELEIGALSGLVLRTATAEVSDTTYPVLEEYIFDTDETCNATGFTKVVRNPENGTFKACVIYCKKQ